MPGLHHLFELKPKACHPSLLYYNNSVTMLRCSFSQQEPLSVRTVCTSTNVKSTEQVLSSLSSGFVGTAWAGCRVAKKVKEFVVNQTLRRGSLFRQKYQLG